MYFNEVFTITFGRIRLGDLTLTKSQSDENTYLTSKDKWCHRFDAGTTQFGS